jgi:Flp pilus assembly protein TadB
MPRHILGKSLRSDTGLSSWEWYLSMRDKVKSLVQDKGKRGDTIRGHLVIFAVCVMAGAAVAAAERNLLPLLLSPVLYLVYVAAYKGAVWIGDARRRARQKRLLKDPAYRAYVERLKAE